MRPLYEGFNKGKRLYGKGKETIEFLTELQTAKISGIGKATINKLLKLAKEKGYI